MLTYAGTFAMRGSLLLSAIDLLDIVHMEAQAKNVETSLFQALVSVLRLCRLAPSTEPSTEPYTEPYTEP
jgi:hypothetical protein